MGADFINFDAVAALVKRWYGETIVENDEYVTLALDGAQDVVRETSGYHGRDLAPLWVGGPDPGPAEVVAPQRARIIAATVAARAFKKMSPGLARRAAGPISESYHPGSAGMFDLEASELSWLQAQRPSGAGISVKRMGAGMRPAPAGDLTPDGYSISRGDLDFAHGMTIRDV